MKEIMEKIQAAYDDAYGGDYNAGRADGLKQAIEQVESMVHSKPLKIEH